MAYIDRSYYTDVFVGKPIPEADFPRLAQAASDIVDAIVYIPISDVTDRVKRATAYQLEMLYEQGGLDAVTGFAEGSAGYEMLGDYSVTAEGKSGGSSGSGASALSLNGIPVSRLAVSLLRAEGLMRRWAYAGTELES